MRSLRRTLSTRPLAFSRCATCVTCCLFETSYLACRAFSAFHACYVCLMLHLFFASKGAFLCCTCFVWSFNDKMSRTVLMAGRMAYTLTEDGGGELPETGAWTLVKTKDAKRQRVCIFVLGVV